MISIANPGSSCLKPAGFVGEQLQLWFGDVISEADAQQCRTKAPTIQDIQKAVAFSAALAGCRKQRSWFVAITGLHAHQPWRMSAWRIILETAVNRKLWPWFWKSARTRFQTGWSSNLGMLFLGVTELCSSR